MKDIRIGNDISVIWSLYSDQKPFLLDGMNISVYLKGVYEKTKIEDYTIKDNEIHWTFFGKDQKHTGGYSLTLVVNEGAKGMVTTDVCDLVRLVSCTCYTDGTDEAGVQTETIALTSTINYVAGDGTISIEIDSELSEESTNPVENRVITEALKEVQEDIGGIQDKLEEVDETFVNKSDLATINGQRIDQGGNIKIEGGGGSYDDTAIKEQLTELSDENERLKERIEEQDQFIEDLQNTKIDRENDDYYPKMAVGLADNLAGVDVVDSEINFRRSGGGAISDGVARIESIKGNSVVWNQLADSLKVYSISADANLQIPIENVNIVGGRKYIAMIEQSVTLASVVRNTFFVNGQYQSISENYSLSKGTKSWLFTANQSGQLMYWCNHPNVDVKFSSSRIYDLTKMFGAGNEPTTIEEFYARIPMGVDLNAYNEGEVIHMDVQSIESVGVNQWDEEWELGTITEGGVDYPSQTIFRPKGYIKVFPKTQYAITSPSHKVLYVYYFDINRGFIFFKNFESVMVGRVITTPENCAYLRFIALGTTYNHDICINLSDTAINGKYFPYIKRVEDLSIIRKYFLQGMKSAGSAYDEIRYNKESNKWEKVEAIGTRAYQDGDADNASYLTDGKITCYPLAEPIVTELDEADQYKDLDYQVWNCGTEKAIAEGKSAPLAADITYGFNAIGKIKELENLVAALRAKVGI